MAASSRCEVLVGGIVLDASVVGTIDAGAVFGPGRRDRVHGTPNRPQHRLGLRPKQRRGKRHAPQSYRRRSSKSQHV